MAFPDIASPVAVTKAMRSALRTALAELVDAACRSRAGTPTKCGDSDIVYPRDIDLTVKFNAPYVDGDEKWRGFLRRRRRRRRLLQIDESAKTTSASSSATTAAATSGGGMAGVRVTFAIRTRTAASREALVLELTAIHKSPDSAAAFLEAIQKAGAELDGGGGWKKSKVLRASMPLVHRRAPKQATAKSKAKKQAILKQQAQKKKKHSSQHHTGPHSGKTHGAQDATGSAGPAAAEEAAGGDGSDGSDPDAATAASSDTTETTEADGVTGMAAWKKAATDEPNNKDEGEGDNGGAGATGGEGGSSSVRDPDATSGSGSSTSTSTSTSTSSSSSATKTTDDAPAAVTPPGAAETTSTGAAATATSKEAAGKAAAAPFEAGGKCCEYDERLNKCPCGSRMCVCSADDGCVCKSSGYRPSSPSQARAAASAAAATEDDVPVTPAVAPEPEPEAPPPAAKAAKAKDAAAAAASTKDTSSSASTEEGNSSSSSSSSSGGGAATKLTAANWPWKEHSIRQDEHACIDKALKNPDLDNVDRVAAMKLCEQKTIAVSHYELPGKVKAAGQSNFHPVAVAADTSVSAVASQPNPTNVQPSTNMKERREARYDHLLVQELDR